MSILLNHDIINGYDDKTLHPNNIINMVEMMKIITNTFRSGADEQACKEGNEGVPACEDDIEWYEPYAAKALERGIRPINKPDQYEEIWLPVDFENVDPDGKYVYSNTGQRQKCSVCDDGVKRKEAVKAIYDAYNYCKDNPDECTLLRSGE